jgi:hypothetical protein
MASQSIRKPAKLTVATSTTRTAPVLVGDVTKIALKSPIAAAITFEGSFDAGIGVTPTWSPIKDLAGADLTMTTVTTGSQPLPSPDTILAHRYIRIVTPAQGADITFEFICKVDR